MSTMDKTTTAAAGAGTSASSFRLGKVLGWWGVRLTLILFCVVWTVPTFGLLISSLRDKDQLAVSGWWNALVPTTTTGQGRTGTVDDVVEEDGMFVLAGSIFDEGDSREITTFGLTAAGTDDFAVGEEATTNEGFTIVVQSDGSYVMTSEEPFPEDYTRGQRVVFSAQTSPRFTLENYDEVLNANGLSDAFINTVVVTIPATIIPIAIAAFASYAFAWMKFPLRIALLTMVVGMLVVPLQLSLIPVLKIYNSFDLRGTFPGLWIAHTAFGLPLAVFLLYNYLTTLPKDIIESAQIDGASHFDIFIRLILPLSVPALASFTIFQFLWVWNDLLVALVFLGASSGESVLTMAVRELNGSRGEDWHIMTAAAFVTMAVPLLVFFSLQRYFVRGLTAGSVKG